MLLRAALDLWRGPALAGLDSRIVRQRAAALDEQRALAVEEWADLEIALGRDRAILGELTALVEGFPLRERLRGQLLVALNNAGRQADALAEYRRARQLLIDELGIEPGEDLRRIHARILSGESTAAVPIGAGAPSPVRSAPVPRELPPPPRSFTARAGELAVLDGLLADEVGTHGGDLRRVRHRGRRQDHPGRPLGTSGGGPLPGRPAVRRTCAATIRAAPCWTRTRRCASS